MDLHFETPIADVNAAAEQVWFAGAVLRDSGQAFDESGRTGGRLDPPSESLFRGGDGAFISRELMTSRIDTTTHPHTHTPPPPPPFGTNEQLKNTVGVVDHGLFVGMSYQVRPSGACACVWRGRIRPYARGRGGGLPPRALSLPFRVGFRVPSVRSMSRRKGRGAPLRWLRSG